MQTTRSLPETLAALLGLDLRHVEERQLALAGRPQPIRCRYAAVRLRISGGLRETSEWTATVGFVATRLNYNLLGHAGFLQYFDAEFRGADSEVALTPNPSFPGAVHLSVPAASRKSGRFRRRS